MPCMCAVPPAVHDKYTIVIHGPLRWHRASLAHDMRTHNTSPPPQQRNLASPTETSLVHQFYLNPLSTDNYGHLTHTYRTPESPI